MIRCSVPGPLGRDWYITTLPIPLNFAPRKARYRVVSSYVCNPIHNISPIVTEARDIEFEVVPYPRTLRKRSSARWRRTVLFSFQTAMAWVLASGSNSHGTMSSS